MWKAKNNANTRESSCRNRKCAWDVIKINSPSSSIIEHFGDIIETNFAKRPWYDAIQRFKSCSQLTIQCVFAWDRLSEDGDFDKKKIIFSDEEHFDLGGYVNKKIVAFEAQRTRTYTLKSRRIQNESLFGADLNPEAWLNDFFSEMIKEWPLQSMATVIGHVAWIFLHRNWRGGYWQHLFSTGRLYVAHSRALLYALRRRADVVWPP